MSTPPSPRRSPWVFIPPPPLFVATFASGLAISRVVPPHALLPAAMHAVGRGVGLAVIAVGLTIIVSAVLLFAMQRTTIVPHSQNARTLVARGPFRITRNPMYLGLTIIYVGAALVANAAWPLALLPLPVWIMSTRVIPYEEGCLARTFGDSYRLYQQRVPRWL